jgi:hypothetical protein
MSWPEEDIQTVQDVLHCDRRSAEHYLDCFDGDCNRTIQAVLIDGQGADWWAHPPSGSGNEHVLDNPWTKLDSGVNSPDIHGPPGPFGSDHPEQRHTLHDGDADPNNLSNDRIFYGFFGSLVDNFIEAVCSKSRRNELRSLILEADAAVSLQTNGEVPESDLINRLSYKHEASEGRSPLSYAVAKCLSQQVYDLIELGAEISKVMMKDDQKREANNDEEILPRTSLVIAATNLKRDGTDMVRILLSKGAKPTELEDAKVDETQLCLGMKYWIDKARRVGIPPIDELRHMANLSPMDRIHELDYAVVGQEAAVALIQEALLGRFGNPQGSRGKLLGAPGHGTNSAMNAAVPIYLRKHALTSSFALFFYRQDIS